MDNLVWNERLKLLANALDRLSTACFSVGGITPFAALVLGNESFGLTGVQYGVATLCWILFGFGPHLLAQEAIRGLR